MIFEVFDILLGFDMVWNNILLNSIRFGFIRWVFVFIDISFMFSIISLDVIKVVGIKVGFILVLLVIFYISYVFDFRYIFGGVNWVILDLDLLIVIFMICLLCE